MEGLTFELFLIFLTFDCSSSNFNCTLVLETNWILEILFSSMSLESSFYN